MKSRWINRYSRKRYRTKNNYIFFVFFLTVKSVHDCNFVLKIIEPIDGRKILNSLESIYRVLASVSLYKIKKKKKSTRFESRLKDEGWKYIPPAKAGDKEINNRKNGSISEWTMNPEITSLLSIYAYVHTYIYIFIII